MNTVTGGDDKAGKVKRRKRGNPRGEPQWKENKAVRVAKEVELRIKGMSFQRIADLVGISVPVVYKDIKEAFKKVDKDLIEKADHLRTVELTRLDRLLEIVEEGYRLKKKKKTYGRGAKKTTIEIEGRDISLTEFIMAYIRIMDRRSRYIAGLDVPKEVKADVGDNFKEAMEAASTGLLKTLEQLAGEK